MTAVFERPMTAVELADLPDDGRRYELSRGMLICMSQSAYGPSRVTGKVVARMGTFIDEHKLGDYGTADGGFRLASDPDTVRAPDAWFVRAERVQVGVDEVGFFAGAPDLVVEVPSPSDRFKDVMLKVRDYLEAGVRLIWVLDAQSQVTAVFRPGAPVRFLDVDDALDGEDVLPGFRLPLGDVFSPRL
jgi:Uma2 family endonuclease